MKDKIKFIRELAENMNENKINVVKYEDVNFEVQMTKKEKEKRPIFYGAAGVSVPIQETSAPKQSAVEQVSASEVNTAEEISGTKIESPIVGTFYIAPSPTSDPFIKEGDNVIEGQTLCIVEAMKLMNEVKSSLSGKVKKILVKDGEAIKKGQVLVIIE